jgi:hypothetical protein
MLTAHDLLLASAPASAQTLPTSAGKPRQHDSAMGPGAERQLPGSVLGSSMGWCSPSCYKGDNTGCSSLAYQLGSKLCEATSVGAEQNPCSTMCLQASLQALLALPGAQDPHRGSKEQPGTLEGSTSCQLEGEPSSRQETKHSPFTGAIEPPKPSKRCRQL